MALTWKRVSSGLYRSNTFNSELWGAVQWWIRRDGSDYSLSLHRLNEPVSNPLVYEGGVDKIETAKRRAARLMTDETVEAVGGLGQTDEYERPTGDDIRDAVVIQDARGGYDLGAEGKYIGKYREWDDVLDAATTWMERNQYWPDIYFINERGNVALLDSGGNEVAAWV